DARLVVASLNRVQKALGPVVKALGGDRGFDSQSNRKALKERHIYNALCPRDPEQLQQRHRSWKFQGLQKRRSQIEPRIAILKENFLGRPLRSKGFPRRSLALSWAVLTHNLWVVARLAQAAAARAQRQAA